MPVNIRSRFNRNRIMSHIANQLCRLGNKQLVHAGLTLQHSVQMQRLRINRTADASLQSDNQFRTGNISLNPAGNMNNAVRYNISLNGRPLTDNRRNRNA